MTELVEADIMRYDVQYGAGTLSLEVAQQRVVGVLAPKEAKRIENVEAAVEQSLREPYASEPLEALLQGKRTALIITVDYTRPSPTPMLLPIIELCESQGVTPSVIIATGRHRLMSDDELCRHLGDEIVGRCRVMQHDAFDASQVVLKGTTARGTPIMVNKAIFEHDIVIGTGIIEPSYLCGWSGGRKLLMPGLAYHESIDNNHYYLTHPDPR